MLYGKIMVVCFKNCTEHISKILDQNVEFKRVCKVAKATIIFVPVCPSVCPHETTQLPLDGFLQNFSYIRRSVLQIKVLLKSGKNNGQFTLMFLTIMAILRSVFRIMRNFSNKLCTENKNTHFMFCKFLPENRAIYEKISKNMMEPERPQTIWSMRFAWWISKDTRAQAHVRSHAPTHPHTHRPVCNNYCFSTTTMVLVNAPTCHVIRALPVVLNVKAGFQWLGCRLSNLFHCRMRIFCTHSDAHTFSLRWVLGFFRG